MLRNERKPDPKTSNAPIFRVRWGRRYYSAELGRWTNRDPIGELGGLNLRCFVLNQAIDRFDSLGLTMIDPFPGSGGGGDFDNWLETWNEALRRFGEAILEWIRESGDIDVAVPELAIVRAIIEEMNANMPSEEQMVEAFTGSVDRSTLDPPHCSENNTVRPGDSQTLQGGFEASGDVTMYVRNRLGARIRIGSATVSVAILLEIDVDTDWCCYCDTSTGELRPQLQRVFGSNFALRSAQWQVRGSIDGSPLNVTTGLPTAAITIPGTFEHEFDTPCN